jgi:hypothetical protein
VLHNAQLEMLANDKHSKSLVQSKKKKRCKCGTGDGINKTSHDNLKIILRCPLLLVANVIKQYRGICHSISLNSNVIKPYYQGNFKITVVISVEFDKNDLT